MLIIWDTILLPRDRERLVVVDPRVVYWPASYSRKYNVEVSVAVEWWISFSSRSSGVMWLLERPEHSRVVYTN